MAPHPHHRPAHKPLAPPPAIVLCSSRRPSRGSLRVYAAELIRVSARQVLCGALPDGPPVCPPASHGPPHSRTTRLPPCRVPQPVLPTDPYQRMSDAMYAGTSVEGTIVTIKKNGVEVDLGQVKGAGVAGCAAIWAARCPCPLAPWGLGRRRRLLGALLPRPRPCQGGAGMEGPLTSARRRCIRRPPLPASPAGYVPFTKLAPRRLKQGHQGALDYLLGQRVKARVVQVRAPAWPRPAWRALGSRTVRAPRGLPPPPT